MKKIRVGVIGVGKAGFLFGKAVNASPNGELAALAATTQEKGDLVSKALMA